MTQGSCIFKNRVLPFNLHRFKTCKVVASRRRSRHTAPPLTKKVFTLDIFWERKKSIFFPQWSATGFINQIQGLAPAQESLVNTKQTSCFCVGFVLVILIICFISLLEGEKEREREWSWMRRGCELLGGVVVEIIRSSILYEENLWIKESILKWQSYSGSICSDLSYFCLVPVEIWKNSSLQSFCTPSTLWINKKGHGRWGIKVVRKRNQRSTPPPASSPPLPLPPAHPSPASSSTPVCLA